MSGLVFMPDALDANRAGRLGSEQRRVLEASVRLSAGGVLAQALRSMQPLPRDLQAGRVESIEGATIKEIGTDLVHLLSGARRGVQTTSDRIWVANRELGSREFRGAQDMYEFAPMAGAVRLFYLPRSRWAINLERLPEVSVDAAVWKSRPPMAGHLDRRWPSSRSPGT